MKRLVALVTILILGLILYRCGGDGGGDGVVTTSLVNLSGRLDTGSLSASAMLLPGSVIVTDDIWTVAIDEKGVVQASIQLAQPLDAVIEFNLAVPSGHDYVIVFHTGSIAGSVLAVFVIEEAGVLRSVVSLPAGMNDTDLGTITIDQNALTATSDINDTLVTLLPPAESEYPDFDGDLIPDEFDWDDDGDGVVDGSGDSTSVHYSLRDGTFTATTVHGSFSTELLYFGGLFDTEDRSFTLYKGTGPIILMDTEMDFKPIYPPDAYWTASEININLESTVSADKNGRVLSGNLMFNISGSHIRVSASQDNTGSPLYDLTLYVGDAFIDEEIVLTRRLTWEELEDIADDPTAVDGYLALTWLGLRGVEFVFQNAQQILGGFEYCYTNRQALAVAGAGNPVTVACDTFPGDGSQGTVGYTWFDTEPSNPSINPGDSFKITYANCWLNDDPENPADSIDEIFDGSIDLSLYYDVREPSDYPNTFMGASHAVLTNLKRTETVGNSTDPGSVTIANTTSLEGPPLWIEFLDYIWLEFYEIED